MIHMPNLEYFLATEKDDKSLREILRKTPMDGAISLRFEREPSFFGSKNLEGLFHQTIIGRDKKTGKNFGLTKRSVQELFVNGSVMKVGYLSLMRIIKEYQSGFPAVRGYQFVRELHKDNRTEFYLTSIMKNNIVALRLLKSGLRGLPRYQKYTDYCTHTIPIKKKPIKIKKYSYTISKFSENDRSHLLVFLNNYGKRHQFYPYWTKEKLFDSNYTPGLVGDNMFIAKDNNKIIGCMAIWDQRLFRQTIIHKYGNMLSILSRFGNPLNKLFGYPTLPKINQEFKCCFLSHIAIHENNPDIFKMLLIHCHNSLIKNDNDYMMVGFSESHSFNKIIDRIFYNISTYSTIYLVSFPENNINPLKILDNRLSGMEVSIL